MLKGVPSSAKVVGRIWQPWEPSWASDDDTDEYALEQMRDAYTTEAAQDTSQPVKKGKPKPPWIHPRCANQSHDIAAMFSMDPSVVSVNTPAMELTRAQLQGMRTDGHTRSANVLNSTVSVPYRSPFWGRTLADLRNDTLPWQGPSFKYGVPWEPEKNRKNHRGACAVSTAISWLSVNGNVRN